MTTQTLASRGETSVRKPLIASAKTIHPEQLDEAGRAALFQELLVLNRQIFDGPGLEPTTEAIAMGRLGKTTLQCYFDATGRCIGFAALLCEEFEQEGAPWSVFRAMTGLLPEYRGRQSVMGFYLTTLASYVLRNPRRRVFFFTPVVHISSYRLVARHALEMYPHPERPVPPAMLELFQRLGARYACARVEGEHPLVCRRTIWVRGHNEHKARRLEEGDAYDRFFQQLNPRSSEGNCLMTLVPLTPRQLLTGALRYARTRASVQLRALRSAWAGGSREHAA
jgi:hypothetical protein